MKIKTNIEGKEVQITLTKEQLAEIAKQTLNCLTIDDIDSIKEAEKILKDCKEHIQYLESQFPRMKDWINYQLETIIKAVNFIDNDYKYWEPNFNDSSYKYMPYFKKESSYWVVSHVGFYYGFSYFSVGFYFKKKESANIISNRFITLYNKWLGI